MGTADMEYIPLDMKQLFFNNMKLLGFDAPALEAVHKIPFNKAMFDLPNRRGAEIVLHFLFQRLNPTMCKEYFRECWPIFDKKREQAFRKTCYTWLTNIAQEEQESRLPRINASLFMSPGGDKFCQLLFYFSGFVREKVMETELCSKSSDRMKYPSLTSQNLQLGEVITKDLTCSSIRHRKAYFDTAQLTLKANKTWKESADDYVKEYRKLSKDVRELDYKIRAEEQKSIEASVSRGSPVKKHGQSEHLDPNFDPGTIKRAQRVQQVRDMWKQLEDFDRTESAEREVVESIVERTINKHRLDAADICVKVPDMLLRECGDEIRRRNVDNTYQGGKLNLVSVLQLWNLCLHLYLEKIHQVGVAKFDEDLQLLKSQLHVQQSYQQNSLSLRQQMAESIPTLKTSIQKLREKLDGILFRDQSPESIRQTSVGLGLVEPSPKVDFSPGSAVTPAGGVGVARSPQNDDTPMAADRITQDVRAAVRRNQAELFGELDINLDQENRKDKSSLPRPSKSGSQVSSRHSSRPTSARSQTSQKPSRPTSACSASSKGSNRSKHTPRNAIDQEQVFSSATSPRTLIQSLKLEQSFEDKENSAGQSGTNSANISSQSQPQSARSDGSETLSARSEKSLPSPKYSSSRTSQEAYRSSRRPDNGLGDDGVATKTGRKTPTDLLVEEIMGEGEILSPFASGLEAFETHVLVRRTPDLEEGEKTTSLEDGEEQIEEILGPELEEEYDNANLSESSQRSAEPVIVINRSLQQSPRESSLPQSPRGSSLQQSPRGWTLHQPHADTYQRSPLASESHEVEADFFQQSPKGSSQHESPRDPSLLSPKASCHSSYHSSPREQYDRRSEEEDISPCDSPHGAIIIDKSFQQPACFKQLSVFYTENKLWRKRLKQNEGSEGPRSQTPVKLPSQTSQMAMLMSPTARLSQSLLATPSTDKSPVTKAMLSQLFSPDALSEEIRQMYKEAIGETPQRPITSVTSAAKGAGGEDDLELPNMDPNSRYLSDRDGNQGLKEEDLSWDNVDNLEDIEMPDISLDRDMDVEIDEINEDKDIDTEKCPDSSLLNIDIGNLDDFFSEKTPDLPKRTLIRMTETEFESPPERQSSQDVDRQGDGDIPEYTIEDEPQLIMFTP